jgi:hypothetical protein
MTAWRNDQVYEAGWMVVPEFQGSRGIAVAATAQAIELAKRDDKHRFMHAFPNLDNAPSNAICRRLELRATRDVRVRVPEGALHDLQRLAPRPTRLAPAERPMAGPVVSGMSPRAG